MPNTSADPNPLAFLAAAGLAGLVLAAIFIAAGFFFSAWIAGLWLRLLFAMHRTWVNTEYARMRGQYVPTKADRPRRSMGRFEDRWDARQRGPRDW